MKKINQKIYFFIILFLGLISSAMLFLPAIISEHSETTFTGSESVFGTEFASLGIFGSGQIELSFLGIFAFSLPVLAIICFSLFTKFKGLIISTILFAVGAILLFLLPTYVVTSVTLVENTSAVDVDWSMGYGLIIAIIASSLGAVLGLLRLILKIK